MVEVAADRVGNRAEEEPRLGRRFFLVDRQRVRADATPHASYHTHLGDPEIKQ